MFSVPGYRIDQQLHTGKDSVVLRACRERDEKPVILKLLKPRYPSAHLLGQFHREYEILHRLDLPGVIKAYSLDSSGHQLFIVLEDFGGESLRQYLLEKKRLGLSEFLPLAIELAGTLAQVHQRMLLHKDINPSNIVLNPRMGQLKLIDFGISTALTRETPHLYNPNLLEGTLAYISPEQSGRMNRTVDFRSDLYSLGVTFYELLTGRLPFRHTDAMQLVHAHLAKPPRRPSEINPEIPRPLCDLVMKLLAKNADERYQSASGLKADLEECFHQWKSFLTVESFPLARHDVSGRFELPQRLYGREPQVRELLEAFERVSEGAGELVLISGYSGVGKSSLVRELYGPITGRNGYFISGKYDQLQRGTPYSALVDALQSLIEQLLTEEQVADWRKELLDALGENGQIIIDVIPKVELIIGPQPPAPVLGPSEAKNRFVLTFQRFIGVFARREHPLTLFLDDLQWADSASLQLLRTLVPHSRFLLVVGAYRDNEVTEGHPWRLTENELRQAGALISTLHLEPLDLPAVAQLIADAFSCEPQQAGLLAELVLHKTGGNPFFMGEFLKSLYIEELLTFHPDSRTWSWSVERIQARDMTDNVSELLVQRVQKLSSASQEALKLAACIGNQFDLRTLAVVHQRSPREVALALWEAIVEHLVIPLDDAYKLAEFDLERAYALLGLDAASLKEGIPVRYKFAHDRIQQAAYSLIATEQRLALHLEIGRLLLRGATSETRADTLFDIVNHLNVGRELLTSEEERLQLAELNRAAGKKAKAAAAHRQALRYFELGLELLGEHGWERHYELTLELTFEVGETASLLQDEEKMRRMADTVLARASTLLDRVKAYDILIQHCLARNEAAAGIAAALQALALLGVTLPAAPSLEEVGRAMRESWAALAGRAIPDLINLPGKTDPHEIAVEHFLRRLSTISYTGSPTLFALCICESVQRAWRHGHTPDSAINYVSYGLLLCQITSEMDAGYQFGKLALALAERLNAQAMLVPVTFIFHCFVRHWKDYAREFAASWADVYRDGLAHGDFFYAALALFNCYTFHPYWMGKELSTLRADMGGHTDALRGLNQFLSLDLDQMYCQHVLNLMGESEDPIALKGTFYNEEQTVAFYQRIGHSTALAQLFLLKLIASYLLERTELALEYAARAEAHLGGIQGAMAVPAFYLYDSLARLAALPSMPEAERQASLDKVASNKARLEQWSRHAPRNYRHKYLLVEAELLRARGHAREATEYYDQAIDLANESQYIQEEAIALELAARHHLASGRRRIALYYLGEAHRAYQAWGAQVKVRQLETCYGELLDPDVKTTTRFNAAQASTASGRMGKEMDLASVLQVSHAISSEIVLERLLATLMKTLIANAGGQRGFLLLNNGGQLTIDAQETTYTREPTLPRSTPVKGCGVLAEALVQYVAKTRESVVLKDARQQGRFSADPYVVARQPKSVLCAPVLHQGELSGILYLENNLSTGAFTPDRLELCQVIASQAAISIENARLYASMAEYNKTLSQRVAERTRELDERNLELSAKNAQILRTQNQLILQEKMASLGTMTAGLAHELKNPLNFVNNLSSIQLTLLQELRDTLRSSGGLSPLQGTGVDDALRSLEESARTIERHGVRANNIVQGMMELSKTNEGTSETIDINTCLRQYATLAYHGAKAGSGDMPVTIEHELDPSAGEVTIVPQHLTRVIVNLVNNAIESLSAKRSQAGPDFVPRLQLRTRGTRDQVEIRIRDNGQGISLRHLKKLFTPFFTTKPTGSGNIGLGLSLSYDIIRGYGGHISVDSREGEFAEFTLTLPRAV